VPGYNIPDVLVVGCGGGGAVVAKELAEAGLGVVALEAGPWHDPQRDFNGLEWDMLNQIDSVLRWGPADRSKPPWPRRSDGIPMLLQTAGVGGNTLHFGGNCPRAYPGAVELEWPVSYGELIPYFERVEQTLPVSTPTVLAGKDERFVKGCEGIGLDHVPSPDVTRPGWRIQPNAILPVAEEAQPLRYPGTDGCTQCGECIVGCRHPVDAPIERTAKRGTNATYAPLAVRTGNCEIRTGCFATAVLTEERRGVISARGVRYRTAEGRVLEQDARVVVLAGGAVESPRLWLASGLPTTHAVGRYLTTHWFEYVSGVFDGEIDMHLGQTSMARAEFPGYGFIEPQGLGPLNFAFVSFLGRWPDEGGEGGGGGRWSSRGRLVGAPLKRRMEAYRNSLLIVCCVDDEALPSNGVTLADDLADENNAAPVVRYHASEATAARRDWLAEKAAEVLLAAGARPDSVHRADAHPSTVHQHGTLRMGRDPGTSVVDEACEAHVVKRLFVADTSAFANGIGGPNPTLTAQALATRTAGKILERYFGASRAEASRG
jgi:choline dehydrogenase-like flavoprotein